MTYEEFKEFYIAAINTIRFDKNLNLFYDELKGFYVVANKVWLKDEVIAVDKLPRIVYFKSCSWYLTRLIYRYFWNWNRSFDFGELRYGLGSIANSSPNKEDINCKKCGDKYIAIKDIKVGEEIILDYSHYGAEFMREYVDYPRTQLDKDFSEWQSELVQYFKSH